MKPKFNMQHPLIEAVTQWAMQDMQEALDTPQTVEKAVIPLYALPKRKGHEKPATKPEQIGSGVLLKLHSEYFLLGATHVFESYEGYPVLVGDGRGGLITAIAGERISAGKPNGGQHYLDASVYHIESNLPPLLVGEAITLSDIDPTEDLFNRDVYLITGFRIKRSNTAGQHVHSHREAFPTVAWSQENYYSTGLNAQTHLALAYEKQVWAGNRWQDAPSPRGMSGGAIIRIDTVTARQLLSAITIEHHPETKPFTGYVLATRVDVHLALIAQNFPDLLPNHQTLK